MNLGLFNFNNYYNRIIKRYDTLREYIVDGEAFIVGEVRNVNFNPNDGISTEQVCNIGGDGTIVPDYAILFEADGQVVSRWFVIEAIRLLTGQYKLSLYRDVIADWQKEILTAPMFIEKATLSANDPLIFNNENMSYNQIKTSETLLNDATKTPWIVGYVANSLDEKVIAVPSQGFTIHYPGLNSWDEYDYARYTSDSPYKASYAKFATMFYFQDTYTSYGYQMLFSQAKNLVSAFNTTSHGNANTTKIYADAKGTKTGFWRRALTDWAAVGNKMETAFKANNFDFWDLSFAYTGVSRLSEAAIADEEGKIVQVGDKFYKIHVHQFITPAQYVQIQSDDPNAQKWYNIAQAADCFDLSNTNNINPYAAFGYTANAYYISKEDITADAFTFTVDGDRRRLTDAPYSMFAIPARTLGFTVNGSVYEANSYIAYRLAQQLITELGSNLYDIQLLPYCPLQSVEMISNNLLITGTNNQDFVLVKDTSDQVANLVLWLSESSFTRQLNISIPQPTSAIELKVSNECDKYRIVSPTYNGEFEFSVAKNGGVSGFNVFCTYKPYTPFIKVAPIFSGLYGEEFQDGRGCICQGDFSLPQINDQWIEYQLQNKNYLNSFNRQIENLDINNAAQREMEGWNILGGVLSGAASTGAVGYMAGGVPGAVVGGLAGGAASLLGGIADINLNEQLRTEARNYAIDQFNYQLGNIQALPYSLANIGAQTVISKLFPFLEYYTCTEAEKTALRNKIKYNGMTVGVIGNLETYIQSEPTYIKGRLIRLEDINDDFHVCNQIADELYKGVFI